MAGAHVQMLCAAASNVAVLGFTQAALHKLFLRGQFDQFVRGQEQQSTTRTHPCTARHSCKSRGQPACCEARIAIKVPPSPCTLPLAFGCAACSTSVSSTAASVAFWPAKRSTTKVRLSRSRHLRCGAWGLGREASGKCKVSADSWTAITQSIACPLPPRQCETILREHRSPVRADGPLPEHLGVTLLIQVFSPEKKQPYKVECKMAQCVQLWLQFLRRCPCIPLLNGHMQRSVGKKDVAPNKASTRPPGTGHDWQVHGFTAVELKGGTNKLVCCMLLARATAHDVQQCPSRQEKRATRSQLG